MVLAKKIFLRGNKAYRNPTQINLSHLHATSKTRKGRHRATATVPIVKGQRHRSFWKSDGNKKTLFRARRNGGRVGGQRTRVRGMLGEG